MIERYKTSPRTPQPRRRKVSVYDLVRALEKALEVKHRRLIKMGSPEARVIIPHRKIDITLAIKQVYKSIREWFVVHKRSKLHFSELLPKDADKDAKIFTFVPLLHLGNQRKVDLIQEQAFDDFTIKPIKEKITMVKIM